MLSTWVSLYCCYSCLQTLEEREWFAAEYEAVQSQSLENSERVQLAKHMLKSQVIEDHCRRNHGVDLPLFTRLFILLL